MTIEVIYRIDRPFAPGVVEAYGEPDMGWYEWRIIEGDRDEIRKGGGKVLADSGKHGSHGQQYGSPSLALRDGLNHDEPPHQGDAQERALEALVNLANSLQGTPDGDHVADMIREAMDTIDGYGKWPVPEQLSDEFKTHVRIWQHKGCLWNGLHLVRDVTGAIHPMVADYVHLETMHSGGLYDSWAAAFAAFGAALDGQEES